MEISAISEFVTNFISSVVDILQKVGPFAGVFIVVLESMIPILPLAVFIALNVITFGPVLGFLISWISTVIGCMIAFFLCRKLREKFDKKYKDNKQINKFKKYIGKMSYSNLVILLAVPFTPAFAINIGAGLSEISPKKYFSALMIGKIPMVYFWGFIGKSLIESITDPYTLVQIAVMLILAYLASKVANKFIK